MNFWRTVALGSGCLRGRSRCAARGQGVLFLLGETLKRKLWRGRTTSHWCTEFWGRNRKLEKNREDEYEDHDGRILQVRAEAERGFY